MTRREKQWRKLRVLEYIWVALMVLGFVSLMGGNFPAPLFWGYLFLFTVGGFLFYRQQYLALDELGRLRWLKSQTVTALVLSLGVGTLMLWAIWQKSEQIQIATVLNLLLSVMLLAALAAWGTWHYLGWRDLRGLEDE